MAVIDSTKPLKPKASAVWLVDNTTLTFDQIADYTGLHVVEVQALADEEVGRGIIGESPILAGELTSEEIERCQKDENATLKIVKREGPALKVRGKGPRYTPVARRNDKPDAIAYILKHHPEVSDAQICKLVGTTKPTIEKIRDKTHPNSSALNPRNPAEIGLCSYQELDKAIAKGLKAAGKSAPQATASSANDMVSENTKKDDTSFDFSNFLRSTGRSS